MERFKVPSKTSNRVRIVGQTAYVDISSKRYPSTTVIVDVADLALVLDGSGRWCPLKGKCTLYSIRGRGPRKARKYDLLHRHLLGVTAPYIEIDHRDGDGLNNRRQNLRIASDKQNAQNSRRRRNGTSQFRGVSLDRARGMWTASIRRSDGKGRESLGRFVSEVAAAIAYDAAASERYGEFARLNFPEKHDGQ